MPGEERIIGIMSSWSAALDRENSDKADMVLGDDWQGMALMKLAHHSDDTMRYVCGFIQDMRRYRTISVAQIPVDKFQSFFIDMAHGLSYEYAIETLKMAMEWDG